MIRLIISCFILFLSSSNVHAQTIMTCTDIAGHGFYPFQGVVSKDKSGWKRDAITGGSFSLAKISNNSFDILYVDSTKRVVSTVQDGGTVTLISADENGLTFIVNYPKIATEIYYFLKTTAGNYELLISQVKHGALITKSSLLHAKCVK